MQDEENKSNELEKMKNLKNQVQKEIENITEQGIPIHDVDILGKLVDIHKRSFPPGYNTGVLKLTLLFCSTTNITLIS